MALEAPGGVDSADSYWTCCPGNARRWARSRPTAAGRWPDLLEGSRRDGFKQIHDLGGFLSDAARISIRRFFGICAARRWRWTRSSGSRCSLAWRALENSGINPDDVAGHDVGCYIGASALEYGPELSEYSKHSGHLITGTSLGVISGRIAYTAGPGRPALTVDTVVLVGAGRAATAAAAVRRRRLRHGADRRGVRDGHPRLLRRILQAARAFRRRRTAAGLQRRRRASTQSGPRAQPCSCCARRSAAVRDGGQILAEVRATGVNSDGRTVGLTAPSGTAQQRLFARTIERAGVRPEEVGMIEGRGTATRLGDRTELRALAQTYGATAPGAGALLEA